MFFFINKVSADKVCYYESGEGKFYFEHAKLQLSNKNVSFRKVIGPEISKDKSEKYNNFGKDVKQGWNMQNVINLHDSKDYTNAAKNKYKIKLRINMDKQQHQEITIPDISNGDCPEYLGVIISDIGGFLWNARDNSQVIAGDESLKNRVDGLINQYSKYNYVIWGTKEQSQAQNPDDLGDVEPGQDFDTCDGLLGVRDGNGEYQEGTIGFLLQQIFDYMKIAVIALIFGFSIKDYATAISSQDQDSFKKANIKLIKRLALGIIFFLIPVIVDVIVGIVDSNTCGIK